jgi:hypothetical protein
MKQLVLFLGIICLSSAMKAQINNAGFEHWSSPDGMQCPNNWMASNDEDHPLSVTPGSFSHSGSWSAQLSGSGGLQHPASITQHCEIDDVPTGLQFYFHGHLDAGDTLYISATVRDGFGNDLFIANKQIHSDDIAISWMSTTCPFQQVSNGPEHSLDLSFHFISQNGSSSFIEIDDVSLNTVTAITDDDDTNDDDNPQLETIRRNGDQLTITFSAPLLHSVQYTIYDLSGALIAQGIIAQGQSMINVSVPEMANGLYVFNGWDQFHHWTGKSNVMPR